MNRRGFFTRLAKAIVIATAAPVIIREVIAAKLPVAEQLNLTEYHDLIYKLSRKQSKAAFDIYVESKTADAFKEAMIRYYKENVKLTNASRIGSAELEQI